jgi:hypothetical protein
MPRRRLLLGLPLLAAAACGERTAPVAGPAGGPLLADRQAGAAGPGAPRGEPFVPATAPQAMPRPDAMAGGGGRALMAARVDEGPELAMILAEQRGGAEQWLAPGPFVLALRAGRVTRTVNLPGRDLKGVVDETPDPLARPDRLGEARTYRRRLQVAGAPPGGLVVESRMVAEGNESVRVPGLGQTRTLRRVRETGRGLEGPVASWRFENIFWLDPTSGRVMASRQEPLPGAPVLALNVIRTG